jgi:hypothetical protein
MAKKPLRTARALFGLTSFLQGLQQGNQLQRELSEAAADRALRARSVNLQEEESRFRREEAGKPDAFFDRTRPEGDQFIEKPSRFGDVQLLGGSRGASQQLLDPDISRTLLEVSGTKMDQIPEGAQLTKADFEALKPVIQARLRAPSKTEETFRQRKDFAISMIKSGTFQDPESGEVRDVESKADIIRTAATFQIPLDDPEIQAEIDKIDREQKKEEGLMAKIIQRLSQSAKNFLGGGQAASANQPLPVPTQVAPQIPQQAIQVPQLPSQEQPLQFNTVEEANAAGLPVGTIVLIRGRRAIIE